MSSLLDAVIVEPTAAHSHSVIWMHGLGASGHDFEPAVPALGLPRALGVRFVFPHAPVQPVTVNGGMRMPSWYDIKVLDLKDRQDFDGIHESAGLIRALITAEMESGIPANRIVLAGFSQGGAMALHVGLRYEQSLAGILALSTYLPLENTVADEASEANRNTPIMVCHGTHDPVIPVHYGKASADKLSAMGYPVEWHEYPVDHSVSLQELVDVGNWLGARLLG